MHDPRREAFERLGGAVEVRVLEPSPPAVTEPPWFADDPAVTGDVPAGRQVVGPTSAADQTWAQRSVDNPDLAAWCSPRWLAAWAPLPPLPSDFVEGRRALHTLAEHVLSAARHAANGKIGLRWTRGGFGAPFFQRDGLDTQVRIDGAEVVVVEGANERRAPITTVAEAALLAGAKPGAPTEVFQPSTPLEPDRPLQASVATGEFLGAWFGLAVSVLEQLRAEARPEETPSRVQLWPEHFDLAVDFGSESAQQRANYGASPGDEGHPDPYLYVGPWATPPGEGWNAEHFPGALVSLRELVAAGDQREAALSFLRERRDALRHA